MSLLMPTVAPYVALSVSSKAYNALVSISEEQNVKVDKSTKIVNAVIAPSYSTLADEDVLFNREFDRFFSFAFEEVAPDTVVKGLTVQRAVSPFVTQTNDQSEKIQIERFNDSVKEYYSRSDRHPTFL